MAESSTTELIFLVEIAPEGGYTARALGHSIFTEADDFEALKEAVRDVVQVHFDPGTGPRVVRLHLVQDHVLAV